LSTSTTRGRKPAPRAARKTAAKSRSTTGVLLEQKIVAVLESLKKVGTYPAPLDRVLDLAQEPEAQAKVVAAKSFAGGRLVCALPPKEKSPAKASVVLLEDVDVVLDGWILAALASLRDLGTRTAFTTSEMAKALPKAAAAPKAITDAFEARARETRWPSGIGSVSCLISKKVVLLLFRIADVASPISPATPSSLASQAMDDRVPTDFAAAFERAFHRLSRELGDRNLVLLRALREALPRVPRSEFDRGLAALRLARRFTLESSDGRHTHLTTEDFDAGVREGGNLLVYAARRES
jgi:hypothetical protein